MYHLLIADDEERIRKLVRKYAVFQGHTITEAKNGMEAVRLCSEHVFDLIILDVMMPELDGFSVCREIRKQVDTPILMLSARGEEYDRIHGFESGVDDYVVKPFSPRELMLRVEAIVKRSTHPPTQNEIFQYDALLIDFTARKVDLDGKRLELTPKEYDLLFYFARNPNIALSRDQLITQVWGYDFYGDERTLDTHVKLLRKSLGRLSHIIVTLRGVGYRFEVLPC